MEKLLSTEQALSKAQMGCWCCFLGLLLNYSMFQTPCVWVASDQGRSWFCSVRAEEPLIWRDPLCLCPSAPPCEGTEVMILWPKRSCLCRWKGTLSAGSLVFIDKCFRVHSCNFTWERWKGCKSFRHYIWNGIQWKLFRRDVWVKALRNVNLISLKYWMWNLVYFAIKNIIFKNILQIFFAPLPPEPAGWS